jgi:hypothetical protein
LPVLGGISVPTFRPRSDKNVTASALFGVAAFQSIVGIIGWLLCGPMFGWVNWLVALGGLIYLALAVAAFWQRLPSAILGCALYSSFLIYQFMCSPRQLMAGLAFKGPIILLLALALASSLRHKASRQI